MDDRDTPTPAIEGPLKRTPLYEQIAAQGARMTEFSGWEMPVQFTGITHEHQAVRTTAGVFDISHMGKFYLQGQGLLAQLQELVPSDLSRLQPGEAQYTVLLNPQAGIMDDLIFYYQGVDPAGVETGWFIVNAATKSKDKAWIVGHLEPTGLTFRDESATKSLLAVQGPQAIAQLQPFVPIDLTSIPVFGHRLSEILGTPAFLARTGYTGEDGFEIMVEPETGQHLWRSLLEAGVTPCGLGARDTLRLEAGLGLYGQDMDDHTTPLEAGLGWLVHWDRKGDFIGRSVLEQQRQAGVSRKLVGLQMQGRNIARHDYLVFHNGKPVGKITSGTMAPTLQRAIALAYVPTNLAKVGQTVEVEIRGKLYPATVVKKPFYRRAA